MKMKRFTSLLLITIMLLSLSSLVAVAADNTISPEYVTLEETRTEAEATSLKEIYQDLFPQQYHYIENYEQNGVSNESANQVEEVFADTKTINNIDYTLIVYSNGQIFANYVETIIEDSSQENTPSGDDTYQKTQNFVCGDFTSFTTFKVTYTIWLMGYDRIDSYSVSGSGFLLYPTNRHYKQEENSDGNAYIAYHNVSMSADGSGVLYDIGVIVGHNKADKFTNIATGLDAFFWIMLHAFING